MALDEYTFTSELVSSLNEYVRQKSAQNLGGCHTPNIRKQAQHKVERGSGYDLLKRISESELLVLEVKLVVEGNISYYSSAQHNMYGHLHAYGVPIRYCYNLVSDYVQKNEPVYTLSNSNACFPGSLLDSDGFFVSKKHSSLKSIVDEMLSSESIGNVSAFIAAAAVADVTEVTTKMLLLAYNRQLSEVYLLDKDGYESIIRLVLGEIDIGNLKKDSLSDPATLRVEFYRLVEKIDTFISAVLGNRELESLEEMTFDPVAEEEADFGLEPYEGSMQEEESSPEASSSKFKGSGPSFGL